MVRSLYSVSIFVQNQNEAIRFYREVFGFEVQRFEPLGPAGSWVEMAPPGQQTALVLYPQAMQPDWQQRRGFILMQCDDVAAVCEALSARGLTAQEPRSLGWGILAMFVDPFGNEIGLVQVTRPRADPAGAGQRRAGSIPPPPPPPGRRR